jgi:hypothetical protein
MKIWRKLRDFRVAAKEWQRSVEVMVVIRGKVEENHTLGVRQVVVNGIFGEPLQRMHWSIFLRGVHAAGSFGMHHKWPVAGQVHGMFRHDYLAVEMGVKSDDERRITLDQHRQSETAIRAG